MSQIVFRLAVWGILFIPWGFLAALTAPHRTLSTGKWLFCGGALSFLLLELAIMILFMIGNGNKAHGSKDTSSKRPVKRAFERRAISFGTVSVIFGAILPVAIVSRYGVPSSPWSILVSAAAFTALIAVFMTEYLSSLSVIASNDGVIVKTINGRQSFLFSEIISGVRRGRYFPFIALKSGGLVFLDGYLGLRRKGKTLGHTLFASFIRRSATSLTGNGDRTLLMRYLSFVSHGPDKSYSNNVMFFLDALGAKSPLAGISTVVTYVPVLFFPIFFVLNILNTNESLLFSGNWFALALLCFSCLSIYVARHALIKERLRMNFVNRHNGSGNLPWHQKSVRLIKNGSSLFCVVLIIIYLLRTPLNSLNLPVNYIGLTVILLPLVGLLLSAILLLSCERKVVSALVDGSPEIALKLISRRVKNDKSGVLSSKRAYALAVSGQKLDLALELARREMCRLITNDTMLYSSMAAARIYQLKGDLDGAVAIARKMLLTFPSIEKAQGIRGRIYFEAKTIIESAETPSTVLQ